MDYSIDWNHFPEALPPSPKGYPWWRCCCDRRDKYKWYSWRHNNIDAKIQNEPNANPANPVRKDYTDMASVLIALSTFAGGFTIATRFIAECPRTRVQALLAIASQLFLGTPLCLSTIYLYLYDLKENSKVNYRSRLHALIVVQFAVSGLMLSTAFILLGVAIFAAEVDGKIIGTMGIVLLGIFLIIATIIGLLKSGL